MKLGLPNLFWNQANNKIMMRLTILLIMKQSRFNIEDLECAMIFTKMQISIVVFLQETHED